MALLARHRLILLATASLLACEKKSPPPPPVPLAVDGGYSPLSTRNPARMHALKQEIAMAFADVPYPGDDGIIDGDNPYDLEMAELTRAFGSKHWKQLSPRELRHHDLAFLSREALQFYLPAYLIGSLYDYGDTPYADILHSTVFALALAEGDTSRARMLRQHEMEVFSVFSPEQKRAIRSFLEYVRDEMPDEFYQGDVPRRALTQYWGRD